MKHRLPFIAACVCAFSLTSLIRAAAEDYTPSDLTAAQILQKAHAAAGKLAPGAYVEVSHSHGGGIDISTTTRLDGDDYITVDTSGAFVDKYGSFGGQSWSMDENGTILLDSDFTAKVDPNVLALEHPEDPQYHVRVLGITVSIPHQYVIEANPPGGSDQFRYYDAKTLLLARIVTFEKDRHKHVVDYDDYRTAFGQTRAYHRHYDDGRADNASDYWLTSISPDVTRVSLAIPSPEPRYTVPENPVVLPAQFTPDGIVVRANIGGRGLDFVLDSGSSSITIDPGVAHDLGLVPFGKETATIGGEVDQSRTEVPQMSVGALTLNNVTLSETPMDSGDGRVRVVGLLGCDFIAGGIIGIDFGKHTVTVYPRDSFNPIALGATYRRPIDVDDCVPRMSGSIEAVPGKFLVDTGAFATLVYQNFIDKLRAGPNGEALAVQAVGGTVMTRVVSLHDLVAGPIEFKRADVIVPTSSTFDITDYDGIFGRDVLSSYELFLDYANRYIYFKPEI